MQDWLWTAEGALVAFVLLAGVADWRRTRRDNLDGWGWMPWRGMQVMALFAAIGLAVLILHNR